MDRDVFLGLSWVHVITVCIPVGADMQLGGDMQLVQPCSMMFCLVDASATSSVPPVGQAGS